MLNQQIRFCRSFDGSRIAYAVTGRGPLLVKAPHWLTHLEYEFESPLWRPWIEELSKHYTLVRMDERACGLSDWDVADISLEAWVRDLEAVVDAAGFATYRQMFAMSFIPGATMEQVNSLSELQRKSASPQNAVRIIRAFFNIDVQDITPRVACPTLVLHGRGDRRSPLEEGRILASLIPGATLVPLETENHILLAHEPAFRKVFAELRAFISPAGGARAFEGLTAREAQILERIAQGLDNAQIAAHLGMSEKTVRNHITHIFDKIGVENRSQAIVLAREGGLGQLSRPS